MTPFQLPMKDFYLAIYNACKKCKERHRLTQTLDFTGKPFMYVCICFMSLAFIQCRAQIQGVSLDFHGLCKYNIYTEQTYSYLHI